MSPPAYFGTAQRFLPFRRAIYARSASAMKPHWQKYAYALRIIYLRENDYYKCTHSGNPAAMHIEAVRDRCCSWTALIDIITASIRTIRRKAHEYALYMVYESTMMTFAWLYDITRAAIISARTYFSLLVRFQKLRMMGRYFGRWPLAAYLFNSITADTSPVIWNWGADIL